jgi:hypothetical protein
MVTMQGRTAVRPHSELPALRPGVWELQRRYLGGEPA